MSSFETDGMLANAWAISEAPSDILTLPRAPAEKVLVSMLMSLGLCATIAMCFRVHIASKLYDQSTGDTLQTLALFALWCRLEECALVAASHAPFLKTRIEWLLETPRHAPGFRNRVPSPPSISVSMDQQDGLVPSGPSSENCQGTYVMKRIPMGHYDIMLGVLFGRAFG
jgi:hypothetical protein